MIYPRELRLDGVLGSSRSPGPTPKALCSQGGWECRAVPQARAKGSGLPAPPSETPISLWEASIRSRRSRLRSLRSFLSSSSGCSSQSLIFSSISSRTSRNLSSIRVVGDLLVAPRVLEDPGETGAHPWEGLGATLL